MLIPWCAQEERLPAREASMRQQLDLWARSAAAIRAGGLHLACELGNLLDLQLVELSPQADRVAVVLLDNTGRVDLLPIAGTQHDLASQLSAPAPGQTLNPPSSGQVKLLELQWSPSGQRLVLVTRERSRASRSVRVSTFEGARLVGSFVEPLLTGRERFCSLDISQDATTMLLTLRYGGMSRVVAGSAQGSIAARHPRVPIASRTAPLDGGRLLAVSSAGDRLYVCSAAGVRELGLHRAAAVHDRVLVSSRGRLATVVLGSSSGLNELLLVDLMRQGVQQSCELQAARLAGSSAPLLVRSLAQGAHAVALRFPHDQIGVIASSGGDFGRELFRCEGSCPQWDPSGGRFLAVARDCDGLHVLDGTSGAVLASWHANAVLSQLRWLPDSRGIAVHLETVAFTSCCVLRFACV